MSFNAGKLTIASGTKTSFDGPSDGCKAILIGNESGITCTITMESGGVEKTLYPGWVDWFQINRGFTGKIKINPYTVLNNISAWPSSMLIFDAIGINDPEDASQYPQQLSRTTNTGNVVTTTGGTAGNLVNDNNAAGTQIVESTVTGDGASAVTLTNDGTMVLGDATNKGSLTLAGHLNLPNNVSVRAKDVGGTNRDFITADTNNNIIIQVIAANKTINFANTAGTIHINFTPDLGDMTMDGILHVGDHIDLQGTGTVLNGSTSGTATAFFVYSSTLAPNPLRYIIILNNFRNGGATTQDLVLPVSFANFVKWHTSDIPGITFRGAGNDRTANIVTTLAAAGGTVTSQTGVNKYSFGDVIASVDTIRFSALNGSAHTGGIVLEGF